MEKTTAFVCALGIIVGGVLTGITIQLSHLDNNKEKELVTVCIESGGKPQYENRNEAMRGCE